MKTLSSADLRSVDNEPAPKVIKLSKNSQDLSKYNEDLLKFSQEKCEFCEKLCFCRYDMLVHNAKHIIIPLKDEIVKCKECKLHFASSMDLEIHTKINHFKVPDILESIVLTKPVVQCDNSLTELVIQNTERKLEKILHKKAVVECDSTVTELIKEKNTEKLKSFVTKQPVIRCEDTLKGLLMSNNTESDKLKPDLLNRQNEIAKLKTDLLKMPKVVLSNNHFSPKKDVDVKPQDLELKHENITPTDMKSVEMIRKENNSLENITNGTHSIKSRLLFEDDISDFEDDIINTNVMKFNNDIITPKKYFNNDICDLTIDDSDDDDKLIQLHPNVKKFNDSDHISEEKDQFAPAVHYEDLTEPSVWECTRCESTFNNRYDLIIHETKLHFHINQEMNHHRISVCPACDRCVIGNHWTIRRHIEELHPNYENECTNKTLKKCTQCNLKYYRYVKHCNNYHFIYKCKNCSKAFEKKTTLTEHIPVCRGIFESHQSQPELSERIGMAKIIKVCELCCLFFKNTQNYKYVLLRDYSKQGIRITCQRCDKQFFEVKLIKLINRHPIVQPRYEYHRKSAPPTTNEKRLQKIQKRLKLMNKLR